MLYVFLVQIACHCVYVINKRPSLVLPVFKAFLRLCLVTFFCHLLFYKCLTMLGKVADI